MKSHFNRSTAVRLVFLGLAMAAFSAFGAGTGMPWEAGIATMGKSIGGFILPTIIVGGAGLGIAQTIFNHGHAGQLGSAGFYAAGVGVVGYGIQAALTGFGVVAAIV